MEHPQIVSELDPGIDWKIAYKSVELRVRDYFNENPTHTLTTTDLAKALLPDPRGGVGGLAMERLFKALAALQKHGLKEYVTKSSLQKYGFGNKYNPPNWHAPKTPEGFTRCPHCSGLIEKGK